MKRLSLPERRFIEGGVAGNVRADGRGRLDFRPIDLETGVVPTANGSARLRLGLAPGETTDVLVGVKAEIGEPEESTPNRGSMKFSVVVPPEGGAGRGTDAAVAAEELGLEVARAVAQIFGNAGLGSDLEKLSIVPGKQCWDLYVDAVVMSTGGGNVFDAVALCARAALATTRIPKVNLVESDVPGVFELEVSDDAEECILFEAKATPLCVTLTKIGAQYVADASEQEELCAGARLTVGVTPKGTVCGLQKAGKGGLPPSAISDMVRAAQKVGLALLAKLSSLLEAEKSRSGPPIGFF